MQTVSSDDRLSAAKAAEVAGVQATTVRKWAERGLIQAAGNDDHGRPVYRLADVARVEQQTRQKGRPRKWQAQIPVSREMPPGAAEFLARGAEAMAEYENAGPAIRTALARLIVRGDPEGSPVTDLNRWLDSKTMKQLRDKIIEIAIVELAEREAGAIRPHRPRLSVEPDLARGAFDTAV